MSEPGQVGQPPAEPAVSGRSGNGVRAERIPEAPRQRSQTRSIYDRYHEDAPVAVEFRRAYAKLSYRMKNENRRCFMVTSAMPGEGKSTAAALMALTVARHRGTRTLLLDADMRRPTMHELFLLPQERGLVEALEGEIGIIETAKDTRYEQLKVITCGRKIDSPTHLLQADRIANVISEMKFYFDTVIIDTPPVLPVSDAPLIGSETDGVLFVIMAGATQRDVAKRAIQILSDSKIELMGALVNNVTHALPYYYSYKYYHYEY
jgi:capsular exopolysaccharide synthesis family protein